MIVILNVKMFVSKQYDNELSKHISQWLSFNCNLHHMSSLKKSCKILILSSITDCLDFLLPSDFFQSH